MLEGQLDFIVECDKMKNVLRRTMLADYSRRENDAEHSWHLALTAMVLEPYMSEPVDMGHVLSMATVHDLVEIYAGDTFAYDVAGYETKAQREQDAADKLFQQLPPEQQQYIRNLWEEFEARSTPDARYADCLDKLQPFLHNTLTEGHTWKATDIVTRRHQVEKRMSALRDFMPELHRWVEKNIENAVAKKWLKE
jgi:putative hydrolase of HD superfamily